MKRLCKMCAGTGRLTSLDQLSRSTAPMSVPCGMCGGLGFVDDLVYRTQAIDLAAENARLKAKLDAVRAACNTTFVIQDPIKNKQIVELIRTILHRILAIIDRDGDE